MTLYKKRKKGYNSAQSIIELSLLGAALLGILGLLIRYAVSLNQSQNSQINGMLEALRMSAVEGQNTTWSASKTKHRVSAMIIRVDDKPTLEGGEKYGSTSYTPTISSGSGTFTNLLQYPSNYGDLGSLPYMDIIINGQHFTFTTAAYAKIDYSVNTGCKPTGGFSATGVWLPPGSGCLTTGHMVMHGQNDQNNFLYYHKTFVNENPHNFARVIPYSVDSNAYGWFMKYGLGGPPYNMWGNTDPQPDEPQLIYWTKIPHTDERFCYGKDDPPGHKCAHVEDWESWQIHGWNVNLFEERWRLDPVNNTGPSGIVPKAKRKTVLWQWFPVAAAGGANVTGWGMQFFNGADDPNDPDANPPGEPTTFVDVDFDGHEEAVMEVDEGQYYSYSTSNPDFYFPFGPGMCNVSFKYYDEIKEQSQGEPAFSCGSIGDMGSYWKADKNARAKRVAYLDYQDGDLDMTYNTIDKVKFEKGHPNGKPKPGFREAKAKISTTKIGELKISQIPYDTTVDHISVQANETVTMVEREIQLSNDTGRFRAGCTSECGWDKNTVDLVDCSNSDECCANNGNENYTCFNRKTKILYVRTPIINKTGHKYKTTQTK